MDRLNSKLPEFQPELPPHQGWFTRHHLWGYAFLLLALISAITLIYQLQYNSKKKTEGMFCIQVVTSAKNKVTGEIRDFPTPCDVPKGWETIPNTSHIQ